MSTQIVLLITSNIRLVTPVMIASVGVMFCERCGVQNLGIEGMISFGAFAAFITSYFTGNAWLGVLGGMAVGALIGLLHSVISVEFGGKQALSGLGINLLASGFTAYMIRTLFNSTISEQAESIQQTPVLENIPVIGGLLSQFSPLTYLGFILVPIAFILIEKTTFGLRVKAAGDRPVTLETAGVNLWNLRHLCVMLCGALGGLAGAYLSIGQMNRFVNGMVASYGMLALVAVKMGNWKPFAILFSSLLFGFCDALQLQLQISQTLPIPTEIIQMLPYAVGFAILAIFSNQSAAPTSIGVPYIKNKYRT